MTLSTLWMRWLIIASQTAVTIYNYVIITLNYKFVVDDCSYLDEEFDFLHRDIRVYSRIFLFFLFFTPRFLSVLFSADDVPL